MSRVPTVRLSPKGRLFGCSTAATPCNFSVRLSPKGRVFTWESDTRAQQSRVRYFRNGRLLDRGSQALRSVYALRLQLIIREKETHQRELSSSTLEAPLLLCRPCRQGASRTQARPRKADKPFGQKHALPSGFSNARPRCVLRGPSALADATVTLSPARKTGERL